MIQPSPQGSGTIKEEVQEGPRGEVVDVHSKRIFVRHERTVADMNSQWL